LPDGSSYLRRTRARSCGEPPAGSTRRAEGDDEGADATGEWAELAPEGVRRLAGREDLEEAAAFVAGAFAAVEEIKRALEVGAPGRLDGVRLTGPPEDRR